MTGNSHVFVLGSYVAACSVRVEHLPGPGESLSASDFLVEAGGKGLNVAIGLRRLGMTVDGLIAVGDDLFGTLAGEALAADGLPAGMLLRVPGRSGAGVGLIDRSGETVIAVYPGANASLTAGHVAAAAESLRKASHVIAQFEIGDAPIAAAFAAARGRAVTVLNPSPFRAIPPDVLQATDLLIVNAAEAGALAQSLGLSSLAMRAEAGQWSSLAAAVHEAGVDTLVVTGGAIDAALWRKGRRPVVQTSFAVDCIDGIGAGDAFLAGLVASLALQRPTASALRYAAACGALATIRHGVRSALPTAGQVADFTSALPLRSPDA